jgi:zinc protease
VSRREARAPEVTAALTRLATYGLPPDHSDRQPASIAALDPARIQAAAAALAIGKDAVVVAGDAKLLRPLFEKAGYAVEAP